MAGDHVVVPVGEAGKVFHGMIRLNDTGAFLWEQCRKETTKEQVLQAMAEKYEVDESVAADDLDRFYNNCEMRKYWKKQMSEFKTEKCEDSKKEDKQESKQESKQEGKKGRRQGR